VRASACTCAYVRACAYLCGVCIEICHYNTRQSGTNAIVSIVKGCMTYLYGNHGILMSISTHMFYASRHILNVFTNRTKYCEPDKKPRHSCWFHKTCLNTDMGRLRLVGCLKL